MSETEYFRQACKDQVKFTDKVRANKDHEIALLELEIKKIKKQTWERLKKFRTSTNRY
jgi:hypothetical protein